MEILKCSLQPTPIEKCIFVITIEVQFSQAAAKSHWWELGLRRLLQVCLQLDNVFAQTALEFQVLQVFSDQAPVIHKSLLLTVAQRCFLLPLTEVPSV